ncbi:MAG TPA: glycine--tRNA ligase subunit beta [Candidatus Acidoferrales bacterium]
MKRPAPASRRYGDFLLEIGCEEIPARMLPRAVASFRELLQEALSAHGLLDSAPVELFATPRRLAARCRHLALREPDRREELIGPPRHLAFDARGKPTRAAESFSAKHGFPVANLQVVETPKGEYIAAVRLAPGQPAARVLAEILPALIARIDFPRSMVWAEQSGPRFIRPVRWLLALLDGRPLLFSFGNVPAGAVTFGHRFLASSPIQVKSSDEFLTRLRRSFVLIDPGERQARIEERLQGLLEARGLRLRPDAALLEEILYLNEFPTPILGNFDPKFLALPEEILITVMRDHQKYFAVTDRRGRLAPHFVAVINLDRDRGRIAKNHERVLRARFDDAGFFWQSDQRPTLAARVAILDHMTFESRLGSYGDKMHRMRGLARWMGHTLLAAGHPSVSLEAIDRAALLAKCDLTTQMVGEFPELQGQVGGLYARAQGESEEVALAIDDHYLPASPDDPCPRTLTGAIVSLADKMDTVVGLFGAGLEPTGSSDPFALRRQAQASLRVLLDKRLHLALPELSAFALSQLEAQGSLPRPQEEALVAVLKFFEERARYIFRDVRGFAYDEVNAVLRAGLADVVDADARLEALRDIRPTEDFEPLAVAFKRIRNILDKAESAENWQLPEINREWLSETAERELYTAFLRLRDRVVPLKQSRRYRQALELIASLRPAVDRFFDTVLVMSPDANLQKNRLTLLAALLREFSTIADFSEIVPATKEPAATR